MLLKKPVKEKRAVSGDICQAPQVEVFRRMPFYMVLNCVDNLAMMLR